MHRGLDEVLPMRVKFGVVIAVSLVAMTGSSCTRETTTQPLFPTILNKHIEVQHVLIGFQGSIPGKLVSRSKAEADSLAIDILGRARAGEDFSHLVQQYTDDQFPGIYRIANFGVTPEVGEFPRNGMVRGFGDTAFSLSVGSVGIANYQASTCPFGWHVIKRLR
jgi:hypothetical protein